MVGYDWRRGPSLAQRGQLGDFEKAGRFILGVGQELKDVGVGVYTVVRHPIQTGEGIVDAVIIIADDPIGFGKETLISLDELSDTPEGRGRIFVGVATLGMASLKIARLGAAGKSVSIGPKILRQMSKRGWTKTQIQQAVRGGQQVRAINKANGNPATRYVHPKTVQSVVVDDVTGDVLQVGGPGFSFGPGSGDLPGQ